MNFLVIGAGIFGLTVAERLAAAGNSVHIVEKRPGPGGNCAGEIDAESGIESHLYGSHIFHTNNGKVWEYLTKFTAFNNYRHKVLTRWNGGVWPMPINLETINRFYGKDLRPFEVDDFMGAEKARDAVENPANLEEKAISLIGGPLYEAFIRGYTKKQWGRDPRELPASIITRLPVRKNYNTDYFDAAWQGIPDKGYGEMFKNMLASPNISVEYNVDWRGLEFPADVKIVHTGMLDELFEGRFGPLAWRSLRFEWERKPVVDWQGAAVINEASEEMPYTRCHEFKHFHPEWRRVYENPMTIICREYPAAWQPGREAYYPVDDGQNRAVWQKYAEKAAEIKNFHFGGRLASYKYWDMDQAVAAGLELAEKLIKNGAN